MPSLKADLFAELVDLLVPFLPTTAQARNLLTLALGPASTTPGTLDLEGSPRERAVVIVERLSRDELWRVLHKANASADWEEALEKVRPRLFADNPTVFLSYAHADLASAEQVEAALRAAGFSVFIDKTALRGGDWDMTIETALREHDRLVLLLSPHSMPHRKEVHREWFYFDQHRKPIHPILIADCDLHSRMLAYQHRDGRADLAKALAQIAADLRQPFQLVTDAAPCDPLQDYDQKRIEDLTQPRHALDRRFVRLTLLIDQGDKADGLRWINPQPNRRFDDLRLVMDELKTHTAMVVLGAPGSGKSTLLRRLQLDECAARLTDGGRAIPFFAPLNAYRGDKTPLDWLSTRWAETAPGLPPLTDLLNAGRMLLLLDALNEMPGNDARGLVGRWRDFLKGLPPGNRAVITCRSLDYSAPLSAPPDFSVPQIELQPMTPEQIREFLTAYLPDRADTVWDALKDTPQMALFSAPFFLKLLVDQVDRAGTIPAGRAALFAGFVRGGIEREIGRDHALFLPGDLLTPRDHQQIAAGRWDTPHALPARGVLIPKLSDLAYQMQSSGTRREGGQVLVDYDTACRLLDHARHEDILKAGEALHVVDEDIARDEVRYFHQLLQEFFAARVIAAAPNPALVQIEWRADRVSPSLAETLKTLADNDPLPPLNQTGWEETTLTAAAMSADPDAFVRGLLAVNLPLAGRTAAASDVRVSATVKREIQDTLIARTQDMTADLRARIAAGEALGVLGDPRFERRTGAHGDYLLPPLVSIEGGTYPIGDDASSYDFEKPAHTVELAPFQIGVFPVTNAEYALFIEAGGYEDERWWETNEAKAWLRGEGSTEGQKASWRDNKKTLEGLSEDYIRSLVKQNRITSEQADQWINIRNMSNDELERQLEEALPSGKIYRQPEFWTDARFNSPAQPVVGVTWFEARAYCAWLTATAFPSPPTPLPQGERGVPLSPSSSPTRGEGDQERWLISPELAAKMTEIARRLRRDPTPSEAVLWQALRNRRLAERKFRRQEAVGAFVLDFYCPQERLAVEIDGRVHDKPEQQRADAERQALLESLGIRFVRLSASLVEDNLAAALNRIESAFLPSPLVGEGSGVRGSAAGVRDFRLPTEVEFEAAARGKGGRKFPYGDTFDSGRCNTFESHLRRSTPVGIFDNATPEGAFDLSGNVYSWTTTIYDQEQFRYPYKAEDGRENLNSTSVLRVLRGGSWYLNQYRARAVYRHVSNPFVRYGDSGFRLVCSSPIMNR